MKPRTGPCARGALGAFAALVALDGCTFVYVEGDHNSISDTGGYGGGRAARTPTRIASRPAPGESVNQSTK